MNQRALTLNLSEITRDLIQKQIKDNIAEALKAIREDRADARVTTEPFLSYLSFAPALNLQAPSCSILTENIDFQKRQRGANFISCVVNMVVVGVVEERNRELLTIKSERYQTALHRVLDGITIVSADSQVKIGILVVTAGFSEQYAVKSNEPEGAFRKEFALALEVEHYE